MKPRALISYNKDKASIKLTEKKTTLNLRIKHLINQSVTPR